LTLSNTSSFVIHLQIKQRAHFTESDKACEPQFAVHKLRSGGMQVIVTEGWGKDWRSGQMHHLAGYKNRGAKNKGSVRTPVTYWVFVVRFHSFLQNIPFILLAPYLLSPINHKSLSNVQVCNIVQGTKGPKWKGNGCCTQPTDFFSLRDQTTPELCLGSGLEVRRVRSD